MSSYKTAAVLVSFAPLMPKYGKDLIDGHLININN